MHIRFFTSNRLENHRWPLQLGLTKGPVEMISLESTKDPIFIALTSDLLHIASVNSQFIMIRFLMALNEFNIMRYNFTFLST